MRRIFRSPALADKTMNAEFFVSFEPFSESRPGDATPLAANTEIPGGLIMLDPSKPSNNFLIHRTSLVETMSILGAFWMCSREMYFRLDMCDEGHGSWGQMGTEVACKTWLSGGRLIVDKRTWFAHMFRTQGGDFGFPYKLKGSAVRKARRYSQDLWLNDKWEHAVHDLDWLLEKFKPVPDWHDE